LEKKENPGRLGSLRSEFQSQHRPRATILPHRQNPIRRKGIGKTSRKKCSPIWNLADAETFPIRHAGAVRKKRGFCSST
jgi:hypothetical protein